MKFLFFSKNGDTAELCRRVIREGHTASLYIDEPEFKEIFNGIVPKVDKWEKAVNKDVVTVFDMVGYGEIADDLIKKGFLIFGAGTINDKLELDREYGIKVMQEAGIKTPNAEEFKSFSSAYNYIARNKNKRLVFKPSGNLNLDWTFVSANTEELIDKMEFFKTEWPPEKPVEFILEEFIDGIEVSTEGWFNGKGFVNINSTMEEKKLCTGDLGVNVGCSGSIVWNYSRPPLLFNKTLRGLFSSLLSKYKFRGPIDINCIVSNETHEPYGLEFTSRFGYSALQAWAEGLKTGLGEILYGIANGSIRQIKTTNDFLSAVRVSIKPYPYDSAKERKGDIIQTSPLDMKHYWFCDVMMDKKDLVVAGTDGVICEVSGSGKTIENAIADVYKNVKKIKTPSDLFYRTDIGERVKKEYNVLQKWGLL